MRTLTITFRGMITGTSCSNRNETEYYCHPEGGQHIPTLSIPVSWLDIDQTTWAPTLITHGADGGQIAVWTIAGAEFDCGEVGTQLAGGPSLRRGLSLLEYHKGRTVKSTADAQTVLFGQAEKGALIRCRGGLVKFNDFKPLSAAIKRTGAVIEKKRDIAGTLEWSADVKASTSNYYLKNTRGTAGSDEICLNLSAASFHVVIQVTNVATVKHAMPLKHFEHYYDFVTIVDDQITLADAQSDRDEYDCVPPIEL